MVMPLLSAGAVRPGWKSFFSETWSNIWAEDRSYYLDYEMLDTQLMVGYGVNDQVGIELSFDNRYYFGGQMDSFIQTFHDVHGIDQNGRDSVEKGLSRVGRVGSTVEESRADIFNNNGLTLLLSYDLTNGAELMPAINLSAAVRYGLESAEGFDDKHPIDYGFSIGLAKRLSEKWYAHAIAALSFYDQTMIDDFSANSTISMNGRQVSGLIALGYHYSEETTILLQYMPYESAIEDIRGLDKTSHEIHLGFKFQTERFGRIEFGVIENAVSFDNSPDFGLHLGWEHRF